MRVAVIAALSILIVGCSWHRGPNTSFTAGGYAVSAKTPGYDAGLGGVTAKFELAHTDEDVPVTVWGHTDLAFGGNVTGWMGQADLEAEIGLAAAGPPNYVFLRTGFAGTLERDPYTGMFAFEVPTVTAGYMHHGTGESTYFESVHFEIAAHGGLMAAGRLYSRDTEIDLVAQPEVGPFMLFIGEALKVRFGHVAIFGDEVTHVFRSATCVGKLVSLCVDTRHILADFVPRNGLAVGSTGYVGVSFGMGWSSGLLPN